MTKFQTDKPDSPAHVAPRSYRTAPIFTPYVVICTMFGALSAGYMSIAFTAPDWLDDLTPAARPAVSLASAQQLEASLGYVAELRDSIAQLQRDVASVKAEVEVTSARQRTSEAQLLALDQRLASPSQATSQTPAAPDASSPQMPKLINADRSAAALETGSVDKSDLKPSAQAEERPKQQTTAAADIKFGPAVVKPTPKPMGIRLSSGPTVDDLRVNWSVLVDNYGGDLKNLEPRYASNGDPNNPSFDLVAGPLKSKAEAVKACKALVAKSVPCKVSEFVGNAL